MAMIYKLIHLVEVSMLRKVEHSTKLDLERIIFIGRTYEEYMDMFSLSEEELKGKKILDCPAGTCSFTALVTNQV